MTAKNLLLNERSILKIDIEELKSGKVTVEKFIERVELRMKNTDSWLK